MCLAFDKVRQLNTRKSWLLAAVESLNKDAIAHATDNTSRLDAEVMLCKAAGISRTELFTHPEAPLSNSEIDTLSDMLSKRLAGMPVAYIVGQREFWSFELEVNEHVLIPRPDTETLVSAALERLPSNKQDTLLELGTGSGAIAIALASECEHPIIATDISVEALAVAKRNAVRHVPGRISFVLSDWLTAFKSSAGASATPTASTTTNSSRIAMVISNPPYLATDDEHLAALQYEPQGALVTEDKGLRDIQIIIRDCSGILATGGYLLLEHGMEQGKSVRDLFAQHGYTSIETVHDLAARERVTLGRTQ